ncbi:sensor domain-containing phosphodiesterase [Litchfieldella rifensis]|uniref:EAL domain-containing protein n=1 Tax=Litchfieldella rifensis TaxID=762643 RepID=A0ABV7LLL9_9GAMM
MELKSANTMSDVIAETITTEAHSPERILKRMLAVIREHMDMDVAFISEFTNGQRNFRYVDSPYPDQPVQEGGGNPLEDTYCQRVIDGRLPELIPDASLNKEAQGLLATAAVPVGAHLSVPIKLSDGSVYGTLCCFSFQPNTSLDERDLGMMRAFSVIAADQVERDTKQRQERNEITARINAAISSGSISMVYQPIYNVAKEVLVGFESLARFSMIPVRTPDVWFKEASQVGLDVPLEIQAIKLALPLIERLPADCYLSVNISPKLLLDAEVRSVLEEWPAEQIVIELTEHSIIERYEDIAEALEPLRDRGIRLAVDDAGAGYASFRHILSLSPDIIKLDMSITRNIDTDHRRRALAVGLIAFAEATNTKIIAEGVETKAEMAMLRQLGVNKAQGYFLGRPMTAQQLKEYGF